MPVKDCDELGFHLFEAGRQWGCSLNPQIAEHLVEHVSEYYSPHRDFETLLERALDAEVVSDDVERHAYKMALGHLFNRRMQAQREALSIPFAPR